MGQVHEIQVTKGSFSGTQPMSIDDKNAFKIKTLVKKFHLLSTYIFGKYLTMYLNGLDNFPSIYFILFIFK